MAEELKLSGKNVRHIDLEARIAAKRAKSPEFREAYDEVRRLTELARSLAKLRKDRGLTQKQLAEQLNTSQQAISRMEQADYEGHTLKTVSRYVEALGARLEFRLVQAGSNR